MEGFQRNARCKTMNRDTPWSVSQLLAHLKRAVEVEVGEKSVQGEIGSCKTASSGHVYFTLKDEHAQLACVMYRYQAASCRVMLREGLRVEISGKATVWEGRGSLQFVVERVQEAGIGSLQQQFEELKRKLEAEGLFDEGRKRPIPPYPQTVGLITSPTGAVIQDMRHRLEQRAPWMQAYLLPVQVQGKGAEVGLARAVRMWSEPEKYDLPKVDYIVLARGGGSLEDLWCFNEELLARAIATSKIPIVSAVGHETDFTIADFVADLRAPTPTAAIELTTPDAATLEAFLDTSAQTMLKLVRRALDSSVLRLRAIESGKLRRPMELLAMHSQRIDLLEDELHNRCRSFLNSAHHLLSLHEARLQPGRLHVELARGRSLMESAQQAVLLRARSHLSRLSSNLQVLEQKIRAASPQNALQRGFALVRSDSGSLLLRAQDAPPGTRLHISLAQGELTARTEADS